MSTQHIVIVGAGPAGGIAAQTLRDQGFTGAVTMVGAEAHAPYIRPPLSKAYLRAEASRESVDLIDPAWYEANDVRLVTGVAVTALHPDAHTISLENGETLSYTSVLLATGSTPRALAVDGATEDGELAGVHSLRTVEHAERLGAELRGGGRRVVVIGSGWIGMEVAASARALGNEVTVLGRGSQPLESALGSELGAHFARVHEAQGVTVRSAVDVQAIVGDGVRVSGVRVAGTGDQPAEIVPADIVLVAIGATPNIELARAAGLAVADGVLVDEFMRTSAADVYAAGDIASAMHPVGGVRIRSEHLSNAMKGAKAAVLSMLGTGTGYADVPTFVSEQYDVTVQFAGYAPLVEGARLVRRGAAGAAAFTVFWLRGQRVVAGVHVNVPDAQKSLQRLIRDAVPVTDAQLADTATALESL